MHTPCRKKLFKKYNRETTHDKNRIYSVLFKDFLANTDSKNKAIEFFSEFYGSRLAQRCLDVGSGAGDITNQLANIFSEVVGLEPNTGLRFDAERKQKLNTSYLACDLVDYRTRIKFNVIFLSYFLDTLENTEYRQNLDALGRLIVNRGQIFGVTFLEDSDWNKYLNYVAGRMGIERKGGFVQISDRLREFGWEIRAIGSWRSTVSGSAVDHLYDALTFFVKTRRAEYLKRRKEFLPKLQEVIYTNNRPRIEMSEVMYLIQNVQR